MFKGKTVIVSGIIHDIDKDIMGTPYVVIGGSGFLDGVQCMFDRSEISTVARLSIGQAVSLRGKVEGQLIGNVLIEKCKLQ